MTADLDVADLDVTAAPRTRRAIIAGAVGGLAGIFGISLRPPAAAAADGDNMLLGVTNAATATTEIATSSATPALKVSGAAGVIGVGTLGLVPEPLDFQAGVYGAAGADPGVYGHADTSQGVRGDSNSNDGVYGNASASTGPHTHTNNGAGVHGHGGQAGVLGTHDSGFGVQATSVTAPALFASNDSTTAAAIVAEGGPGTAIHGHANAGGTNQVDIPNSPALTGIYGSAFLAGVAIAAQSESGLAVKGTSSAGHGIRGRGALDGTIGESTAGRSGVVGFSGSGGAAPAGPAKTGVYGEATQDATSRGVSGFTLAGQGVRGEATTGMGVQGVATSGTAVRGDAIDGTGALGHSTTGKGVRGVTTAGDGVAGEATTGVAVRATATTGVALAVSGRTTFNRSGRVAIPVGPTYIDVTVPGGTTTTAIAFATLQYPRTGVYVVAARPNYPTTGKLRIYLNKALPSATYVAWFVVG